MSWARRRMDVNPLENQTTVRYEAYPSFYYLTCKTCVQEKSVETQATVSYEAYPSYYSMLTVVFPWVQF